MDPIRLCTERLELVAATVATERAAREGTDAIARLLGARAPVDWPPPLSEDVQGFWESTLAEDPAQHGWTSWYWLLRAEPAAPLLVGYGGFRGLPRDGYCEVGYSIVASHQRRGLATEGTRALVDWAFEHPEVQVVRAHTLPDLAESIGVLAKLGFELTGPGEEIGTIRYELRRGPVAN